MKRDLMRSRIGALGSVLVVALASAACTVMSGVDDMELRTSASPVAPQPQPQPDAGTSIPEAPFPDVPFPFGPPDAGAPPSVDAGPVEPPGPSGPATCGAEGSWSACGNPTATTVTSCAIQCAQQGWSCVDSCCAYDALGDYPAKVGMVYALASECSLKSITSAATFGLCADPIVLPVGIANVRCCCK